jgi:hypothetical protein
VHSIETVNCILGEISGSHGGEYEEDSHLQLYSCNHRPVDGHCRSIKTVKLRNCVTENNNINVSVGVVVVVQR